MSSEMGHMIFGSETSEDTKGKDQKGDLEKTPIGSLKMAASYCSRKRRRKLLLDSDSDSDREKINDGSVTMSSRQKKGRQSREKGIAAARKISNGGSDLEEDALDQQFAMQRRYNKEKHCDISPSSDSEVGRQSPYGWGSKDQEENAKVSETPENSPKIVASTSSRKRRKKLLCDLSSDGDKENDDCFTPRSKLGKRRVPLSEEKVNRQHCLQELKGKRIVAAEKKSFKGSEISSEVTDQLIDQLCSMQKCHDEEEHHDISPCTASSDSEQEGEQDDSQNVSVDVIVVESSDEPSSCDSSFIDDTDINSQDIQELDYELMLLKTPSLKQAFNSYLSITLSRLLHNNPANETDLWFEKCKNLLDDTITSKKELVGSTAWCKDFQEMIKSHFALKKRKLRHPLDDLCQACRRSRHLTKRLVFRDEDNRNKVVQKFVVGIYCAERGALIHRLHNHLSVRLERKCQKKINDTMKLNVSVEELVELCMSDEDWVQNAFKRFQYLLDEADRWAADGDKNREMKAAVSGYN